MRGPLLEPDREQLDAFVNAVFKHAGTEGFVSLGAFIENDDTGKPFRISGAPLKRGLKVVCKAAADDARRAANAPRPVVFCPPIAVFNNEKRAREQDLLRGLVLSVESDQRAREGREKLEDLLGPATAVIASGGEWVDPGTGEVQDKLHLHWRLAKAAEDKQRLAQLKLARDLAARLVGGDPTNKSVVHPIRWPGSWHRKGKPKLCRIVAINPEREIDLDLALAMLQMGTQQAEENNGKGDETVDDLMPPLVDAWIELCKEQEQTSSRWEHWSELISAVLASEEGKLHDSLVRLSAKLIVSGMQGGAAINLLRALMQQAEPQDARWQARYDDIPRGVYDAEEKFGQQQQSNNQQQQTNQQQQQPIRPVDLWGQFTAPELPRGLLPKAIEEFAFAYAELMGADPAGLAMSALTICGSIVPDSIKVQVKTHTNSWLETTRLWTGMIGQPASMKSPIMRAAAKPLVDLDTRLYRQYLAEKAAYDALSAEDRKQEEEPKLQQLRLEDTTLEAAQDCMRNNVNGLLLLQDELSGFFGGLDRYSGARGAAKDRGFWLESWFGGPKPVNRVGRGVFVLQNTGVSMLGGIQPDVIRKLADDTYDDGLITRLLPIMLRPATLGVDKPMPEVGENYKKLVEELHALTPGAIEVDPFRSFARDAGVRGCDAIEFDDEAQVIRRQLERQHLEFTMQTGINRRLLEHVGKYNGYFARLCLLFHCIEHAPAGKLPAVITADTARPVAKFLQEFILPHAISFYVGMLGLADDHDRLAAVAGFILAHKLDQVSNRDMQRSVRTMRKLTRKEIEAVFEQLESLGWVVSHPGHRPTDPRRWAVNPEVHRLYAQRAEEEAARRGAMRKILRERFKTASE
jgi:Protein of unknown function (DUF3987)